jgi:hypothetical protein
MVLLSIANKFDNRIILDITKQARFLYQPTGQYGVGYQDIHIINNNLCPDIYYSGQNIQDFSPNNLTYSHEIMLRVYYPTSSINTLKEPYYAPIINNYKNILNRYSEKISSQKLNQYLTALDEIKTYSSKNDSNYISKQQFPIILFVPGTNTSVQMYENFIANLVSHGYIVIGINSLFISGDIELPNGYIVKAPPLPKIHDMNYVNKIKIQPCNDFEYILNNLNYILEDKSPEIASQTDFSKVGALGHSLGGMIIVNYLHKDPTKLQAGAALEISNACTINDDNVYQSVNIPFMHQVAASRFDPKFIADMEQQYGWIKTDFSNLGNNGYIIIHRKNDQDYVSTGHINFSDFSTLMSNEGINFIANQLGYNKFIGSVDGYEFTKLVNNYLVSFFDIYLKDNLDNKLVNGVNTSTNIEITHKVKDKYDIIDRKSNL